MTIQKSDIPYNVFVGSLFILYNFQLYLYLSVARQRSMLLFEQAIKSEATKKAYQYQLKKFRTRVKIKNHDGLFQALQKQIQEMLQDCVMYLKKKNCIS